ncbi:hypothetical protein GCM10011514_40920 [Emticicia aquatilis]|uniref:Uncharacterized protein n=2 Tax=Emticicia aquatilis TaxID=1537369 RepID=A0A917DW93_9BACT|nr:hypothetical protein GCM10011514_40920 [Emticicia aquatilis]
MDVESGHRFTNGAVWKYHFRDSILVHCPKCNKQATVKGKISDEKEIECKNCYFKQVGRISLFKPIIDFYCYECGNKIYQELAYIKSKFEALKINCSKCKNELIAKPKFIEVEFIYKGTEIVDPYFGCSLWLQTKFKNDVLWAFNHEHLNYIKNYVTAKLRERQGNGYQTLAEVLPQFIKSSKNRIGILKAIEKLNTID